MTFKNGYTLLSVNTNCIQYIYMYISVSIYRCMRMSVGACESVCRCVFVCVCVGLYACECGYIYMIYILENV